MGLSGRFSNGGGITMGGGDWVNHWQEWMMVGIYLSVLGLVVWGVVRSPREP